MSFNNIIDSVIASINADISTLIDLRKDTQDVTLIAGDVDTIHQFLMTAQIHGR